MTDANGANAAYTSALSMESMYPHLVISKDPDAAGENIAQARTRKVTSLSSTFDKMCRYRASSCAKGFEFSTARRPRIILSCAAGLLWGVAMNFSETEAKINWPDDLVTIISASARDGQLGAKV